MSNCILDGNNLVLFFISLIYCQENNNRTSVVVLNRWQKAINRLKKILIICISKFIFNSKLINLLWVFCFHSIRKRNVLKLKQHKNFNEKVFQALNLT